MKRPFSFLAGSPVPLLVGGTSLIAATYGLVRFAYGLFLPEVQGDLAFDIAAAGAISAGSSIVYCLAALVGFVLAPGRPRALVLAAAASGALASAGMAAAPDAGVFAAFAIAGSAAAGFASPALVAVLQRNAATSRDPRAQAVVNAGTGPGLVAAGVLALVLLPDWRAAWMLTAVFTVVAALIVVAFDHGEADGTPAGAGAIPPASWFTAHLRVLVAALLLGFGTAAVWNYAPTFMVHSGASALLSTAAWIALGVGGTAVIATARPMARLTPRRGWALTALLVAAADAALTTAPAAAPVVLLTCAVFGWAYTAGTGALIAWTGWLDAGRAASGTALLFVTLILGQALGAAAIGALIPLVGYPAAFLVAASASAAAALPAVMLQPHRSPRGDGERMGAVREGADGA